MPVPAYAATMTVAKHVSAEAVHGPPRTRALRARGSLRDEQVDQLKEEADGQREKGKTIRADVPEVRPPQLG